MATSITAPKAGNLATPAIPARFLIIMFIGIVSNTASIIPIRPAIKPIIKVYAVNTLLISFLLAPTALKIPISLIRSRTEI